MTLLSIQSGSQPRSARRVAHAPAAHMSRVMQLCQERHLRLTALRQQVLELLWQSARPMGAYELINGLGIKSSRAVAPPTVYRTLDFLVTQGFAAKIESRNAYVPCAHPERCHEPIFLICGDCEEWVELDDLRFEQQLAEQAAHAGFRATGRVVEVLGTCVDCSA